MIDPFWDDCSKKKYETPVIEETADKVVVTEQGDIPIREDFGELWRYASHLNQQIIKLERLNKIITRRVTRLETMFDLLGDPNKGFGDLYGNEYAEYQSLKDDIHNELWQEDEE